MSQPVADTGDGLFALTDRVDLRAPAELIVRVGRLLCSAPAIRQIDHNPVIAYPAGQGVRALDALFVTDSRPRS